METSEALEKVLLSFERYYNVKKTDVTVPFAAEAEFKMHNEQYFLIKAAKVADIDSREFVYFALEDNPEPEKIAELCEIAWDAGLSKVTPGPDHRNSDVTMIFLCKGLNPEIMAMIKKMRKSKNYRFGFYGWSSFKVLAFDLCSGKSACNYLARDLGKSLSKLLACS